MGTTSSDSSRIAELERQLAEVTRRLTAMERAAAGPFPGAGPGPAARPGPGEPARRPDGQQDAEGEPDGQAGGATVGYWGAGQFGPRHIVIRQQATLSQVLAAEPEALTPVFAALASPARLTVLRALIGGPRTSQQLREVLDDPSVGQLYHHLRELLAAGLVIQPSRSVYAIPPGKITAVCVAVTAAAHLMATTHQYPPPPPGPEEDEPADGPPPGD